MNYYPRFQGSVDRMSNNPYKYFINNHLHNGLKPARVGDNVHLTTLRGCFKVYGVDSMFFVIMKNRELIRIPWEHLAKKSGLPGTSERAMTRSLLEKSIREMKGMIHELRKY